MKRVAIIPARGGSKRIPRKNVRPFAGLPMIAHSIRAAHAAGVFDRVLVSTDCEEIAAIAIEHGAEAPFRRPASLSGDFIGTDAVNLHALEWLAAHDEQVDAFCCIYATAPFISPLDLKRGLDEMKRLDAVSALSVASFPYPIFRALKVNASGGVEMFWPENFPKRSQDLPPAYHDAGQFYWFDVARYVKAPRMIMDGAVPIFIPRGLVQDIDTPEDWEVAELLWQKLNFQKELATPVAAP